MTASIRIDGKQLFLNPFMETLLSNVLDALSRSLKEGEGASIEFVLKNEEIMFLSDGREIPLTKGTAQKIVRNILEGILKSLHGIQEASEFRFMVQK